MKNLLLFFLLCVPCGTSLAAISRDYTEEVLTISMDIRMSDAYVNAMDELVVKAYASTGDSYTIRYRPDGSSQWSSDDPYYPVSGTLAPLLDSATSAALEERYSYAIAQRLDIAYLAASASGDAKTQRRFRLISEWLIRHGGRFWRNAFGATAIGGVTYIGVTCIQAQQSATAGCAASCSAAAAARGGAVVSFSSTAGTCSVGGSGGLFSVSGGSCTCNIRHFINKK